MTSTRSRRPQKSQHNGFIEAARALDCDESEEHFDAALAKIAAHKPPDDPKSGKTVVSGKQAKRL
jgi:hypothetical protein